jgi:peptidoglycan/LPS O-acetylase OafA/YrhL
MLQHLWSLGVEEQFYLFWPLITAATLAAGHRSIAAGTGSVRRMVARLSLLAIALAIASTALTWILADAHHVPYGNDGSTLYFGTDTHSMGLLLGAGLGAWAAVQSPILARSSGVERCVEAAGATALLLLVLFAFRLSDFSYSLYRGDFLVISALVAVVIAVVTRPGSVLGWALETPAPRWVGVRSYSLYVWHWPITVVSRPGIDTTMPTWLDQALRLTFTILLSDLTYRFIETPVRRHGWRAVRLAAARRIRNGWRRVPPRLSVATPVAMLGVGGAAIGVILVGPAAPTPEAAVGATSGGEHLVLHHPGSVEHVHDPTGLPRISAFGDSVLLGARRAIGTVFPGGSIDAVVARQPDPILDDVRRDARAGTLHPLVVLHVGNNGLINPDVLQLTLRALSSRALVIVLNDHTDPTDRDWQKPNNATLSRVVPEFGNTALVDWDKLAGEHPGWLYGDQLHLRPAGTTAYANLLATTYREATGTPS